MSPTCRRHVANITSQAPIPTELNLGFRLLGSPFGSPIFFLKNSSMSSSATNRPASVSSQQPSLISKSNSASSHNASSKNSPTSLAVMSSTMLTPTTHTPLGQIGMAPSPPPPTSSSKFSRRPHWHHLTSTPCPTHCTTQH